MLLAPRVRPRIVTDNGVVPLEDAVRAWLASPAHAGSDPRIPPVGYVAGTPGSGRSFALRFLRHALAERPPEVHAELLPPVGDVGAATLACWLEGLPFGGRGWRGSSEAVEGPPGPPGRPRWPRWSRCHVRRAFLPDGRWIWLVDVPEPLPYETAILFEELARVGPIIASRGGGRAPFLAAWHLEPWTDDDVIEFMLSEPAAVRRRVLAHVLNLADRHVLRGSPALWSRFLRLLSRAGDVEPWDAEMFVSKLLTHTLRGGSLPMHLAEAVLATVEFPRSSSPLETCDASIRPRLARLLRYPAVSHKVAAAEFVRQACLGGLTHASHCRSTLLPRAFELVRAHAEVMVALSELLKGRGRAGQALAATLLHGAGVGWRPEVPLPDLTCAHLPGVDWRELNLSALPALAADLTGADLRKADLSSASLRYALLDKAKLTGASLRHASLGAASLAGADLSGANAEAADFEKANLTGAYAPGLNTSDARFDQACLENATLARAVLTRASFRGTTLGDASFEDACLRHAAFAHVMLREGRWAGASLAHARFADCDFSEADLAGNSLADAVFVRCELTAAGFAGADLARALFNHCGLAHIDLEGANLREATFRGCTFHLGSSRSGLLFSPIACEGSRTGFYTEELAEQDYRPIEEIRKANLRGADLRGADLGGLDFYLVDVRGALCDAEQEKWFAKCGAILHDPA